MKIFILKKRIACGIKSDITLSGNSYRECNIIDVHAINICTALGLAEFFHGLLLRSTWRAVRRKRLLSWRFTGTLRYGPWSMTEVNMFRVVWLRVTVTGLGCLLIHIYQRLSQLPIPSHEVVSRPSRFVQGSSYRGCCCRREHSVTLSW